MRKSARIDPQKVLDPGKWVPATQEDQDALEAARTAARSQLAALQVVSEQIRSETEAWMREFGTFDEDGSLVWTEDLCQRLGLEGVKVLLWLARRGDQKAAQWLAEKALGAPEQPFAMKVQDWSVSELVREMYQQLRLEGKTDERARALILETTGEAVPALPEWGGESE